MVTVRGVRDRESAKGRDSEGEEKGNGAYPCTVSKTKIDG